METEKNKIVMYDIMLKLEAGKATPAPPVGAIIGPSGINVNKFCEEFNEWSKDKEGFIEFAIHIYEDLSYKFLTKEEHIAYKENIVNELLSNSPVYNVFNRIEIIRQKPENEETKVGIHTI